MSVVQVQTPQNVAIAYRTAGVGTRIVAYLIDALIVTVYVVFLIVIATLLPLDAFSMATTASVLLVSILLIPIVFYHLLCEVFLNGQSLGKRTAKIQVVRLDGSPPTVGAYLLRWVLRFVDITLFSGAVAVVAIINSEHDQRLGDIAAGTTVIRLDEPASLDDALQLAPGSDHVIQFPQVRALTEEDVRTLHAVLAKIRADGRTGASRRLAERTKAAVEQKMGIAPADLSAHLFLRQVARDYAALDDTF